MSAITLKNIPDRLKSALKKQAVAHHRSLNSEVIACLEEKVYAQDADIEKTLTEIREIRETSCGYLTRAQLKKAKNK